jgi:hypothetical protein
MASSSFRLQWSSESDPGPDIELQFTPGQASVASNGCGPTPVARQPGRHASWLNHIPAPFLVLLLLLSNPDPGWAGDPVVQAMGDNFVASVAADWNVKRGSWGYVDVADCFESKPSCFGSNPSSPYGYPMFGDAMQFHVGASEAVVIFMRTPPEVRYFGFTQYLFQRAGNSRPLFASLGDTMNQMRLTTLQSVGPGVNPFDQYAVLVWTADLNTLEAVGQALGLQGIPVDEVNFMPLPIGLPLRMGYGQAADTFAMLMRSALPTRQADFDQYLSDAPFYVLMVGPKAPPPPAPAPLVGYASEVSGVTEDAGLTAALNALIADIKTKYFKSYLFRDQTVKYGQINGLDCIAQNLPCSGDNHDALYSNDLTKTLTVSKLTDVVIVAGVNHRKTGKVLYLNHSVYDSVKRAGIIAVDDSSLSAQSALYHAGVTSQNDPRVLRYKDLYAYAISYDCRAMAHCSNIPAPTVDNPVGLQPGAPFDLVGRGYVDPRTNVRPAIAEIIRDKVLVGITR